MFASELVSGFGNSRNRVSGSAGDQNTYECVSIICSQHPNVRDKYWADWEERVLFVTLGIILVGITLISRIKVRDREYCFNFSWI